MGNADVNHTPTKTKRQINKSKDRFEIFAREYVIDLNASRAARAAGYAPDSAEVTGSQLLSNPKVRVKIDTLLAQRASKLEVKAEQVVDGLRKLAFFDYRKFFNPDGSLIPINELDEEAGSAIEGFEVEEAYQHFGKGQAKPVGTIKKYKIASRGQNLERLGRHLKLFTDKVEVSGLEGLAEVIEKARRRAGK